LHGNLLIAKSESLGRKVVADKTSRAPNLEEDDFSKEELFASEMEVSLLLQATTITD
jgi:hypothetical protein